jgi:hypothetical protein
MTKSNIWTNFQGCAVTKLPSTDRRQINLDIFIRGNDRSGGRQRDSMLNVAPRHMDFRLLKERAALDKAWLVEVTALIRHRRLGTPEAEAAAEAARAATSVVVQRIDALKASTLDGLRVKARADLWRRRGEPSADDLVDDVADVENKVEGEEALEMLFSCAA